MPKLYLVPRTSIGLELGHPITFVNTTKEKLTLIGMKFFEHAALFTADAIRFLERFNCADFTRNIFDELRLRDTVFAATPQNTHPTCQQRHPQCHAPALWDIGIVSEQKFVRTVRKTLS